MERQRMVSPLRDLSGSHPAPRRHLIADQSLSKRNQFEVSFLHSSRGVSSRINGSFGTDFRDEIFDARRDVILRLAPDIFTDPRIP